MNALIGNSNNIMLAESVSELLLVTVLHMLSPSSGVSMVFTLLRLYGHILMLTQDLKPANVLNDRERIARLKPQLSQPGGPKRAESTPLFPSLPGFPSAPFIRKHMNGLFVFAHKIMNPC